MKPTRRVRWIAALLATLGVFAMLLMLVAPFLLFFLFPGVFFWIGRFSIAAGSGTYNTRLFWCAGAVWECIVIGAYTYSCSGKPLGDFLQFAGMITLPLLSVALSILVIFWLNKLQGTAEDIHDTVQQDIKRFLDATHPRD